MKYRPEIDGLRALAVIPVVMYHADIAGFPGGFIGVDVFFVISGYLITAIILDDLNHNRFSIVHFYERRARRILPALFLVLLVTLPLAWLWLMPPYLRSFSQSLTAISVFASNFLFWITDNYFGAAAILKPMLNTWSLAVEEQFYVIFPIVILLIWRLKTKWILIILVALWVVSIAYSEMLLQSRPSTAFYLLPARGWELLLGALVSLSKQSEARLPSSRFIRETGGFLGIFMIVLGVTTFDHATPFPGVNALIPTIGALLVIVFATTKTFAGKMLSFKPLVGIGLISYSAYLWHFPVLSLARHRSIYEPEAFLFPALALASFVLAFLSWKFVEQPFRDRGRFTRRQIFAFGISGSIILFGVGIVGHLGNGFPARMPAPSVAAKIKLPIFGDGWCFYSVDSNRQLNVGKEGVECWLGNKSARIKGVLFGDSFAGQYEPLWDIAGREGTFAVNAITTNWCYPSNDKKYTGNLGSPAYAQCLFNRNYVLSNLSEYDLVILGGEWGNIHDQGQLNGAIDLIEEIAPKVPALVVMASPKLFDIDVGNAYLKSQAFGELFDIAKITANKDKSAVDANTQLKEVADKYSNVMFIDRRDLFTVNGEVSDLTAEDLPFSLEGRHISVYGAEAAAAYFVQSDVFKALMSRLEKIRSR